MTTYPLSYKGIKYRIVRFDIPNRLTFWVFECRLINGNLCHDGREYTTKAKATNAAKAYIQKRLTFNSQTQDS